MTAFKELVENQQQIRIKLTNVMIKNPEPLRKLAASIGISPTTLLQFLKHQKDVDFVPLFKIYNYVLQKESE